MSTPDPKTVREIAHSPRLFRLLRDVDHTGVSGTGTVAHGVVWPDGTVTLRWIGDRPSTVNWAHLADAEYVHGHGGATRFAFDDVAMSSPDEQCDSRARPDFVADQDIRCELPDGHFWHRNGERTWTP